MQSAKIVRKAMRLALPRIRLGGSGTRPDEPLFVIGSGRSGNTLVRRVLLASGQIFIPPETFVLGDLIEGWHQTRLLPWRKRVWLFCAHFEKHQHFDTFNLPNLNQFALEAEDLKPQTLRALIEAFYLFLARQEGSTATRWGDKTPWNTHHLPAIASQFPMASFVWLVRDGRDVVSSYVSAGLYEDLPGAARRWVEANRACAKFAAWCPRLLKVRYEDLVTTPEAGFGRLFDWAGLEFRPEMLESRPDRMGDVEALAHHANVQQSINASSVGKWKEKLGQAELDALPESFWTEMTAQGYGAR